MNSDEKLRQLSEQVRQLQLQQELLNKELSKVQQELLHFGRGDSAYAKATADEGRQDESIPTHAKNWEFEESGYAEATAEGSANTGAMADWSASAKASADWEKFLGENLLNKIGIAITILGVAIGSKYAIDHDLISPVMRIIVGYLFAGGLFGIGLALKNKYTNYSAVLVSGSLTMAYFLTYFSFSYYDMMGQLPAFVLMVALTGFTVWIALWYNQVVIALIGMIGAYAVPILLSDGSGKIQILLSYMTIVNIGILWIAFKRNWMPLLYSSFGLSWMIFLSWFIPDFSESKLAFTLIFSIVFFFIFYAAILANRMLGERKVDTPHLVLILINSFVAYGIGVGALYRSNGYEDYTGLFTLLYAALHLSVVLTICRNKEIEAKLSYLAWGLVFIFMTLTIPVQFDGSWVTLLWILEGLLLFWIARTKRAREYEFTSLVVSALALYSLFVSWPSMHEGDGIMWPFLGSGFILNSLVIAGFGGLILVDRRYPQSLLPAMEKSLPRMLSVGITVLLYFHFLNEIGYVFDYAELSQHRPEEIPDNISVNLYKNLSQMLYTVGFVYLVTLTLTKQNENRYKLVLCMLNAIVSLVFLCGGLLILSELREGWLINQSTAGTLDVLIRYPAIALFGLMVHAAYRYLGQGATEVREREALLLVVHAMAVWVLSSELLNILDLAGSKNTYKLGLSILWATYSFLLIFRGIKQKQRFIRIAAFALFGITIVKLFVYDLTTLSTISKTIVFVALGLILLASSFLYNKFRESI